MPARTSLKPEREARFWQPMEGEKVHCHLCPQNCRIAPGRLGFCGVRRNVGGRLFTENYGRVAAFALDPIEKKPLYHFYPGSTILSLGTLGCNFRCGFCQNWHIAHGDAPTRKMTPEEAVEAARVLSDRDCVGIAFTYSEPLMWYEYVYDTAVIARSFGLKNVLVTNGYVQTEPLAKLLPYLDAMNIDVKGFTEGYYREICKGTLEPVKQTVEQSRQAGCHVEVTTLVVPDLNDAEEEIEALTDWLAGVGVEIPLHLSRYFPNYKMDRPATPPETLERARRIAAAKLRYVYVGNIGTDRWNNTYCYECGTTVIRRSGPGSADTRLKDGRCPECGSMIDLAGEIMIGR